MPESPRSVLEFWFGDAPGRRTRAWWFTKNARHDRTIAERYTELVETALVGGLSGWGDCSDSALARILVLDQFPRNIYRGSARAFAGDALALAEALTLIDGGGLHRLAPVQQVFVLLPLEHAEDLVLQQQSVTLFEALAAEQPAFGHFFDYARRHHDVIRRFGRFPHRNLVLGRRSSRAESAFLARPGSGF